jgi:ABC-type glutathione transport system ATPase component
MKPTRPRPAAARSLFGRVKDLAARIAPRGERPDAPVETGDGHHEAGTHGRDFLDVHSTHAHVSPDWTDAETGEGTLAAWNLGKSYKSRKVVQDVSLNVRRGEAVGLLGPNGAGKTTVFYMITGLVKPDKGVIELDGHDVTLLPMYRRARLGIGYLPQEASIFRGLNVEDNIRAVLEVSEPDRDRREEQLEQLLAEFDIARLRKSPSIALSGGERRRCARSPRGRHSSCSTNHSPASIRSRWATSRRWCIT